jgi:hypothetical protein
LNLNSEEKRNANLSAGALQILNNLNRENQLVANQVASKSFFDLLEKYVPGRGLSANAHTIAKFNDFYASSNEWVRSNFFAGQTALFEKPLAAGVDADPSMADVVGVVAAALEVIELRDLEITGFKRRFNIMPGRVKRLIKRLLSR